MTKPACGWCGRPLTVTAGPGRPRRFCRPSCKQRDYEARRRAAELGLGEHELVLTREALAEVLDRRFLLACAFEEIERDLAAGFLVPEEALGMLRDAVREALEVDGETAGSAPNEERELES